MRVGGPYPDGLRDVLDSFRNLCLPDALPLLATLGAVAGSQFEGTPAHFFLIGPSSSGKNEILESLFGLSNTRHVSTFTDAALLSGTGHRDRRSGATGGVLMEFGVGKSGTLIITEFNSILRMPQDKRNSALGALQDVCTGFLDRSIGVDGGTTLHWHGKVHVIAGCTAHIEENQSTMGRVGERFLYCYMPKMDRDGYAQAAVRNARNGAAARSKRDRDKVVPRFLNSLTIPDCTEGLLSDFEETLIIAIANFCTQARSPVGRNYKHELEFIYEAEGPARMLLAIQRLLCGLRVIGVPAEESLRLTARVGLGCIPTLRRKIIYQIAKAAEHDRAITVPELKLTLPNPDSVLRRTLEDLAVHSIVQQDNTHYWTFTEKAFEHFFTGFELGDAELCCL